MLGNKEWELVQEGEHPGEVLANFHAEAGDLLCSCEESLLWTRHQGDCRLVQNYIA